MSQRTERISGSFYALVIASVIAAMMAISTLQVHSQVTPKRFWERHMVIPGNGKPNFNPTAKDPEGIFYTVKRDTADWIYSGGVWIIDTTKKQVQPIKGDTGPIGPVGPQGPPGKDGTITSTIFFPFTFPERFGAIHANKTFAQDNKDQNYINTNFPGIGATVNDPIDWAAWQLATNEATATGKNLFGYGEYWINNKKIIVPKIFKSLTITGASCYLNATGTDGSAVLGRPSPIDNTEANLMVESIININGLQLGSHGPLVNRIGVDLGPSKNNIYTKVDCYNMTEAIHLRFSLNTMIVMCEANGCIKGWTADMGNWPGADNANSQSNNVTMEHNRFYAAQNSDYGIAFYAASGGTARSNITEGFKVRVGIDWDSKGSNVVKGFESYNNHFECVYGASEAFIKLRMQGGSANISFCYGQYGTLLIDATGTAGYPMVTVESTLWWVPDPVTGKYFKNSGCTWILKENDNFCCTTSGDPASIRTLFTGTVPTYCPGPVSNCGGNAVLWYGTGRL